MYRAKFLVGEDSRVLGAEPTTVIEVYPTYNHGAASHAVFVMEPSHDDLGLFSPAKTPACNLPVPFPSIIIAIWPLPSRARKGT